MAAEEQNKKSRRQSWRTRTRGRWALTYVSEMGRMLVFVVCHSFGWPSAAAGHANRQATPLHRLQVDVVVVLTAAFTGMVLALQVTIP